MGRERKNERERLESWAASTSPVDIFFPNTKKHPGFAKAKAHVAVLVSGETLVVPSDWWWYSVALEPCSIVQQRFWNELNRKAMFKEFENALELEKMSSDERSQYYSSLTELREMIE